jgi:hypothetical protein
MFVMYVPCVRTKRSLGEFEGRSGRMVSCKAKVGGGDLSGANRAQTLVARDELAQGNITAVIGEAFCCDGLRCSRWKQDNTRLSRWWASSWNKRD